jgi:hypothetical protein
MEIIFVYHMTKLVMNEKKYVRHVSLYGYSIMQIMCHILQSQIG